MIFNQCKRPSDSWLTTALKNNTVKYCLVKVGSSFLSILRSVYLCYFFSPYMSTYCHILHSLQGTEVRFLVSFPVNFLLWQYVINPPEKKLAKRTSVSRGVFRILMLWVLSVNRFLFSTRNFFLQYWHVQKMWVLKVNKFQNENMKPTHCPKYERKILKNSDLNN